MKSLYARFDEAHDAEPISGPHLNGALTDAALSWLDDRLVKDDVVDSLRAVLPDAGDEVLAAVIGAVCRVVRQP